MQRTWKHLRLIFNSGLAISLRARARPPLPYELLSVISHLSASLPLKWNAMYGIEVLLSGQIHFQDILPDCTRWREMVN